MATARSIGALGPTYSINSLDGKALRLSSERADRFAAQALKLETSYGEMYLSQQNATDLISILTPFSTTGTVV